MPRDAAQTLAAVLARKRVPIGFGLALVVFWLAAPTPSTLVPGGVIVSAGEALRIWAAGHLYKSREVTASGPYRWLAHPLYVGSAVIGAGVAVVSGSLAAAAIIAGYLTSTLTAAIRTEEAHLREVFGDRYDRYRRGGAADEARRFSVAQAIANREYKALGGVVAAWLLLAAKAAYNGMFGRADGL
jgi:hypothetical protein